jgi:ribonucleoside-diphosphate reductase alpha chain
MLDAFSYFRLQEQNIMSDAAAAQVEQQLTSPGPVAETSAPGPPRAARNRLPLERPSRTHKFTIAGHEGYITVGLYPDGQPGEIFITMAKEGSTIAGLMNSFALSISIALQHGVPLQLLCEKFSHTRFEPSGWTSNPELGFAKSIMDYIFRWLHLRFIKGRPETPRIDSCSPLPSSSLPAANGGECSATGGLPNDVYTGDAPACHICGAITVRSGSCYRCLNCGSTSGCG